MNKLMHIIYPNYKQLMLIQATFVLTVYAKLGHVCAGETDEVKFMMKHAPEWPSDQKSSYIWTTAPTPDVDKINLTINHWE